MSQTERFKRALERAGALAFSGTGYRFVALRYAGPRGEGAARYGGRYNPPGVRTVYLSWDARTAVAGTGYGVSPAPGAAVPGACNLAVCAGRLLPGSTLRLAGTGEGVQ